MTERTFEISGKVAGLSYPYRYCARKFLGVCTDWEYTSDEYDFNDVAVKKTFIDMGVVCTVEVKP